MFKSLNLKQPTVLGTQKPIGDGGKTSTFLKMLSHQCRHSSRLTRVGPVYETI